MITDRITLNLISIYLDKFQANEGSINKINLSITTKDSAITKTITFDSIFYLNEYINQFAKLTDIDSVDCFPLRLFELKSFNTTINYGETSSNMNPVQNDNRIFTTSSNNINKASLDILNKSYVPAFIEVLNAYNGLNKGEYILNQNEYIDCGYIQVYFEEQLTKVRELYAKYKYKY